MIDETKTVAFPVKDPTGELRETLQYLGEIYTKRYGIKYNRASVIRKLASEAQRREQLREKVAA